MKTFRLSLTLQFLFVYYVSTMKIFLILILMIVSLSGWQGFASAQKPDSVKERILSDGSGSGSAFVANPCHSFKTHIISGTVVSFGAVFGSSGKLNSASKYVSGAYAPEVRSGFG